MRRGASAPTSFASPPVDRTPSGGRTSPVRLPPFGDKGDACCPGRTARLAAVKKRRKTTANRHPANTKRRWAGEIARKRTTMDFRYFSMGMPPVTSRLERGGREFLQCIAPRKLWGGEIRRRWRSGGRWRGIG